MKNFKLTEIHVAVFGLVVILILASVALSKGLDGIMFGSSMSALGAVIGFVFKSFRPKNR